MKAKLEAAISDRMQRVSALLKETPRVKPSWWNRLVHWRRLVEKRELLAARKELEFLVTLASGYDDNFR